MRQFKQLDADNRQREHEYACANSGELDWHYTDDSCGRSNAGSAGNDLKRGNGYCGGDKCSSS